MFFNKTVSDEHAIEAFKWPDSDCHYFHQRCRAICRERLNLEARNEEGTQLGLAYCNQYGAVTPENGVTVAARWGVHGCPHDPHRNTKRHQRLCCGHTTIPLHNEKSARVFAWNPDCKAKEFVFGD